MSALNTQVDGDHYKDQKIQPIELAYMLGETPAFTKLAKYLTRDKNDKLVNIDKALHCISLEEELSKHVWKYSYLYFKRLYWKVFKSGEIHPMIKEFSADENIQQALQFMFLKDYNSAKIATFNYRCDCEDKGGDV